MMIVRNKIYESPDNFELPDKTYVEWDSVQYLPVTFGFFDNKLYWSDEIIDRSGNYPGASDYGNKKERVKTHSEMARDLGLKTTDEFGEERPVKYRYDFQFPGRLWRRLKIISFWTHPEEDEMQDVLKQIGSSVKENILGDPEWKVEIWDDENSVWKMVPVSEYTGSDKINKAEFNRDHVKSPLLKRPNSSLAGKYHSKKQKPLAWRQAMYAEGKSEIVKSKLFENPDEIKYNGNIYGVIDKEAKPYPFTVLTNNKKIKDVAIGKIGNFHGDDEETSGRGVYPGRIYTVPKVLTFWVYPNEKELIEIIKIIESKLGLKILNNDWKIEVYNDASKGTQSFWNDYDRNGKSSIIPIEDYIGSENVPAEEYEEHTKSPLLKRPKNSAAYKYQKNLKNRKPLAWRQAMYAESVKEKLNYDRKIN